MTLIERMRKIIEQVERNPKAGSIALGIELRLEPSELRALLALIEAAEALNEISTPMLGGYISSHPDEWNALISALIVLIRPEANARQAEKSSSEPI